MPEGWGVPDDAGAEVAELPDGVPDGAVVLDSGRSVLGGRVGRIASAVGPQAITSDTTAVTEATRSRFRDFTP
jgi:hypothetical protein